MAQDRHASEVRMTMSSSTPRLHPAISIHKMLIATAFWTFMVEKQDLSLSHSELLAWRWPIILYRKKKPRKTRLVNEKNE